jgi:hypothetical protein
MYIPPYFPEPETIPGCVANADYDTRLAFVRRVVYLHLLAVAPMFGLAWLPGFQPHVGTSALLVLAVLLALTLTRRLGPGGRADRVSCVLLYPVLAWGVGGMLTVLSQTMPVTFLCMLTALLSSGLYTATCGRDFSFLGQFFFSLVAPTAVALVQVIVLREYHAGVAAWTLAFVLMFFVVYDLAALLQRRRDGEQWPAVIDLFRDSLNFITYGFRVIAHVRKFRI